MIKEFVGKIKIEWDNGPYEIKIYYADLKDASAQFIPKEDNKAAEILFKIVSTQSIRHEIIHAAFDYFRKIERVDIGELLSNNLGEEAFIAFIDEAIKYVNSLLNE